jgi:hypothetical protein
MNAPRRATLFTNGSNLDPIDDTFPDIDDPAPEPVAL